MSPPTSYRVPYCTHITAPDRSTRHYLKKSLLSDGDAHGAGGTGDDLLGGVNVVGIEVRHLDLGDLGELLLGELTNLVGLGLSGTRLEVQLLLMR